MKAHWSLSFLAAVPLFFLFQPQFSGPGFPLLNAVPNQIIISPGEPGPLSLDMVPVEGGLLERPNHTAHIPSFMISRYETTFTQYDAFCRASGRLQPPDSGYGRGSRPAGCVSWYDAVLYCNWLSLKEGLQPCYTVETEKPDPQNRNCYDLEKLKVSWDRKADGYRLPTEAEWQYAAQGGQLSSGYMYAGSDTIEEVAWYYDNSGRYPVPVGLKTANELGLYDMSGNVFEWTWDWYSPNYSTFPAIVTAPTGIGEGSTKVIRGGSCFFDYKGAGTAYRKSASPAYRVPQIGFRAARGVLLYDR